MKIKILSGVAIVLLLVFIAYPKSQVAWAMSVESVPNLEEGKKSTLSITLSYKDDQKGIVELSDIQLKLHKVASLEVRNGVPLYQLLEGYKETELNVSSMNTEQSRQYASILEDYITLNNVPGISGITDKQGRAEFTELDPGMYLVTYQEESSERKSHLVMDSFLVMVPGMNWEQNEVTWNYVVDAKPKFEITVTDTTSTPSPTYTPTPSGTSSPTPSGTNTPSPTYSPGVSNRPHPTYKPEWSYPPKTGDDTNISLWWCIFVGSISGLILLCITYVVRTKKRHN